MFTGLVSDIGTIVERDGGQFAVRCTYPADDIALGASIACDGCCLTVTRCSALDEGSVFHVDVSNETLSCTTLDTWTPGRRVNLERSLKLGDELGGHLVTGHVDGLATIVGRQMDGESVRFELTAPKELSQFIAAKGSVALDGTSLTVNVVDADRFTINLIPHTLCATTWGERQISDSVNLEVDLLARYVARIASVTGSTTNNAP